MIFKYNPLKLVIAFVLAIIFNSCKPSVVEKPNTNTFIKDFSLDHFSYGIKKWEIRCNLAIMDELNDKIKCYPSSITIYSNSKKASDITSKGGYGEFSRNLFYLNGDVKVISYSQNLELYCDKLYFDSMKEIIYSDHKTTVMDRKNKIMIISKGFKAKSDLSNIRFFNHSTKKI